MVDPLEEAPVVPLVDDPLEVVALPEDGVLEDDEEGRLEDEPLLEPMPEEDPDTDEPLDDGLDALLPDDGLEALLLDGEDPYEPVAEPVLEPMPDAEPEAVPEALGPVELHAARVNAQANGKIHLVMFNSLVCC